VSDHTLASSKNACDITLKHVLLPKLNLRQNPAKNHTNFCSESFDITTLPEPLLLSMYQNLAGACDIGKKPAVFYIPNTFDDSIKGGSL
jgi:hypothetical protein